MKPESRILAAVSATILSLLAGCTDTPSAEWSDSGPFDKPRERIVAAMAEVLAGKGFQIESKNEAEGVFVTKWRVSLRPQWRQGQRERVELCLDGQPGTYVVKVLAPREVNDNAKRPLSEPDAIWIPDGGNEDLAIEITYALKLKLNGFRLNE